MLRYNLLEKNTWQLLEALIQKPENISMMVQVEIEDVKAKLNLPKAFFNAKILSMIPEKIPNKKRFLCLVPYEKMDKWRQYVADTLFEYLSKPEVNKIIGSIIEFEYLVCIYCDMYTAIDLSYRDVVDLMEREPWIEKMFTEEPLLDNMTPIEIKALKDSEYDKLYNYIMENKINPFYTLLRSGCVKAVNFQNVFIFIGARPNPSGDQVMPIKIAESWARGIATEDAFFAETATGRNALIATKIDVSLVGSFGNKIVIVNMPNYLHPDPEYMCDTVNFKMVHMDSMEKLKQFQYRYYMVGNEARKIDINDESLIGKTLAMRSPTTCASSDGICKYCFADELYHDNVNINIGTIIAKLFAEIMLQLKLSGKHNTDAKPQLTEFKYFEHDNIDVDKLPDISDVIYLQGDSLILEVEALNLEFLEDQFEEDEIERFISESEDDMGEDDVENFAVYTSNKFIINSKKYGPLPIECTATLCIPMSDVKDRQFKINNMEVMFANENISSLFNQFSSLLQKPPANIETLMFEMTEILEKARKGLNPLVPELLCRNLVRDINDKYKKVDWSKPINITRDTRTVNYVEAIKTGNSIEEKIPLGYFNDITTDIRNYDKNFNRPSSLSVFLQKQEEEINVED
jgi:hypothetical protein